MSEFKDFYITRFALTEGIIKEKMGVLIPGEFACSVALINGCSCFRIGVDCFENREEAIIQREKMRKEKCAALMQEILDITELDFNNVSNWHE
jgi:hypothetical protein